MALGLNFFQKKLFIILAILGIAGFFRLWQLDSIPPGLYPDVALNGNEALETLKTGDFKVFYPENNGREGLMMWLTAFSFQIFGISVWSIKIVAAVAGILTVLGLYLLARELFQNTKHIALLASFFLAISFWHTNFSRIGFRAVLLPLISVFAFYFLFRAFRSKKIQEFIISGVFFGLGFYTYTSYRLIVLLIPLLLICLPFYQNKKRFLFYISCFMLTAFLVALPLGLYFISHPQDFAGRMAGVSIFAAESPLKAFSQSLLSHLAMFNIKGDQNWRHNLAGSPMLPWPLGILFLIGIVFSIKKALYSLRNKNHEQLMIPVFLLAWFFSMFFPGILTREGIPHSLRIVGVIPIVYIFTALGACLLYEKTKLIVKNRTLLLTASFLLLFLTGFSEFYKYFFAWGRNPIVRGAFTSNFVEIGNQLNSLPENIKKYVIVNEGGVTVPFPNGIPVSAQTPMFIEKTKNKELKTLYLLPQDLENLSGPGVIIPMKYEKDIFDKIKERFSDGEIKEINGVSRYEIK